MANFKATRSKIQRWRDLDKKAKTGDKAAVIDAAIAACDMGKISFDDLEEQLEEMGEPTEAQTARIDVLRVNEEVASLQKMMFRMRNSDAARKTVAGEVAGFHEAKTPPTRSDVLGFYWVSLAGVAAGKGDVKLMTECVEAVRKAARTDPDMERYVEVLTKRLGKLKGEG